jgi:biopolymer transport protein TolQ
VVQLVLLILVLGLGAVLGRHLRPLAVVKRARNAADDFEGQFWSGGDLSALYRELGQEKRGAHRAGRHLPQRLQGIRAAAQDRAPDDTMAVIMGAERSMRVA